MEIEIEVENIKDAVNAVCVVVVVASFLTLGKMVPTSDWRIFVDFPSVLCNTSYHSFLEEPKKRGKRKRKLTGKALWIFLLCAIGRRDS